MSYICSSVQRRQGSSCTGLSWRFEPHSVGVHDRKYNWLGGVQFPSKCKCDTSYVLLLPLWKGNSGETNICPMKISYRTEPQCITMHDNAPHCKIFRFLFGCFGEGVESVYILCQCARISVIGMVKSMRCKVAISSSSSERNAPIYRGIPGSNKPGNATT